MNARFWIYYTAGRGEGGYVKLTLRPGQKVCFDGGWPTGEGYSWFYDTYRHDGDRITSECGSGGSDCDGPIERHSVWECTLAALQREKIDNEASDEALTDVVFRTPWTRISASQRDTYAEAAGY